MFWYVSTCARRRQTETLLLLQWTMMCDTAHCKDATCAKMCHTEQANTELHDGVRTHHSTFDKWNSNVSVVNSSSMLQCTYRDMRIVSKKHRCFIAMIDDRRSISARIPEKKHAAREHGTKPRKAESRGKQRAAQSPEPRDVRSV